MNCPSIVWVFMTSNSLAVSADGLFRISFGMAILPTSWSSAANSSSWRCVVSIPSSSAMAWTRSTTEREWSAVYLSSNSTTSERSMTVPR